MKSPLNRRKTVEKAFPKEERLTKNSEFKKIFHDGKKLVGSCIVCFFLGNCSLRKIGIITTKKLGNAVVRNRTRRILRECYRLNKTAIPGDVQIVLLARKGILERPFRDVCTDFTNIIKNIQTRNIEQ